MQARNRLAALLTVVSLVCLVPGLTRPVLTITASFSLLGVSREIFRQTQSILQSIQSLYDSGNAFVAGLILLFSVLVPLIKAVFLVVILVVSQKAVGRRLYGFVRSISKWSMADVFVVGIFIAFLAANSIDNLQAEAGAGLYWFSAYCLISNLAFHFLTVSGSATERSF